MVSICVIGCGNMGGALLNGLDDAGYTDLIACDVDATVLDSFEQKGIKTTTDTSAARSVDIVVLAVKPDLVSVVLSDLELGSDQTLVSIAAGIGTEQIEPLTDATVIRLMPNLAAEWGLMAGAVAGGTIDDRLISALESLGEVVIVDESMMDIATALNGSGPAFVFYFINAMAESGIERGLRPETARILAAQTFKGAAETVLQSEETIEELIEAVCSPKGTTIEGMEVLKREDVAADITEAVFAAEQRATELASEADL